MKRIVLIPTSLFASLLPLISVDQAVAETLGPYFYRAGDPESYSRCETTIHLSDSKLVVDECVEYMHFMTAQGPRQCWSQVYGREEFSASEATIEYMSGDIERVDRRTRRYTIEDHLDHHMIVHNVREHFDGWGDTSASWSNR